MLGSHVDRQEDHNLSGGRRLETPHPYGATGKAGGRYGSIEVVVKSEGPSNCLWLRFDPRCATLSDAHRVEIWAPSYRGKLLHSFSGPRRNGKWPQKPLVITSTSIAVPLALSSAP